MREVTLQVESGPDAPGKTRSHVSGMKSALEPRYDDVVLVVSELVSNSVRHTESQDIGLRIASSDGQIRVEVSDEGPGFAPEAPRGEGLGLSIVEKLAERWGLDADSDRFTVWAELSRSD